MYSSFDSPRDIETLHLHLSDGIVSMSHLTQRHWCSQESEYLQPAYSYMYEISIQASSSVPITLALLANGAYGRNIHPNIILVHRRPYTPSRICWKIVHQDYASS